MLTVARAYLRSAVSVQSDEEMEEVGLRAYGAAGDAARELREIPESGVEVDVREGTLSIVGVIVAAGVGLYVAITAYDSFWSGVERLREHAIVVGRFLRDRFASDPLASRGPVLSTRISAGHLDKLHRLRVEVATRRRTPDEAVQEALRTLRSAGEDPSASVVLELENAFNAPHRGAERLQILSKHVLERGAGVARGEREGESEGVRVRLQPQARRRHLKISRPPGAGEPVIRFEK